MDGVQAQDFLLRDVIADQAFLVGSEAFYRDPFPKESMRIPVLGYEVTYKGDSRKLGLSDPYVYVAAWAFDSCSL